MNTQDVNFETACRIRLDEFFGSYRDVTLRKQAMSALVTLLADGKPLVGKPEGWAAGIIYATANQYRIPCGVPGLLNSEFTEFFGVSMETIRTRAARIAQRMVV